MSQVNGQLARGRMRKVVWELLACSSLEHAASVWWTGGKIVSKKLEADQDRVSKKVLGASGRCRCARRPRMEEARGPKEGGREEDAVWKEGGKINLMTVGWSK